MEIPTGVTKRQLHYWITKGYIFTDQPTNPGRGHPLPAEWDEYTRKVIQAMARMRELGFEAPQASELAHKLAEQDWANALWLKVSIDSASNLDVFLPTITAFTWAR
jgi:hypothetical protein